MKNHKSIEPRVLNLQDGESYSGISYSLLRQLVLNGVLSRVTFPSGNGRNTARRLLILKNELDKLIDSGIQRGELSHPSGPEVKPMQQGASREKSKLNNP